MIRPVNLTQRAVLPQRFLPLLTLLQSNCTGSGTNCTGSGTVVVVYTIMVIKTLYHHPLHSQFLVSIYIMDNTFKITSINKT